MKENKTPIFHNVGNDDPYLKYVSILNFFKATPIKTIRNIVKILKLQTCNNFLYRHDSDLETYFNFISKNATF